MITCLWSFCGFMGYRALTMLLEDEGEVSEAQFTVDAKGSTPRRTRLGSLVPLANILYTTSICARTSLGPVSMVHYNYIENK
jgi:hypothetical protein